MFAVLNGHGHIEPDWTYVGRKVNQTTGSRRTKTYKTNLIGTTKLRDGSVYLDPGAIHHQGWHQQRRSDAPQGQFIKSEITRKTPDKPAKAGTTNVRSPGFSRF